METLDFLKAILPPTGTYFIWLPEYQGRSNLHAHFTDLAAMAKQITRLNDAGVTTYHACASFKGPSLEIDGKKVKRHSSNAAECKAFWVDIDCGPDKAAAGKGYATKGEAALAVKKFCTETGLPTPLVVDSGGGLHLYYPLIEAIPASTWKITATSLKSLLANAGVLADPSRTADVASILRPVGSVNRKYEPERVVKARTPVQLLDFAEFSQQIAALVAERGILAPPTYAADLNDDLTSHIVKVPSYAEEVADKCAQVAMMRDTKGDVGYETWRGVIGIIKHCEEGLPLAQEWSSLRAATGHSQVDVVAKYDTWSSGPATCAFFAQHEPSLCLGCTHNGKIKSPIVLGRRMPEEKAVTVETVEDESNAPVTIEIPPLPKGFVVQDNMMIHMVPNDGVLEPIPFSRSVFFPTQAIVRNDNSYLTECVHIMPGNRLRKFTIDNSVLLGGGKELRAAIGKYNVVLSDNKNALAHMEAFVRNRVAQLQREAEDMTTHTTFGWKADGFLVGDSLITPKGRAPVKLTGYASKASGDFFPKAEGSAARWTESVDALYNRECMEPMQYAVASAFGSVLTPFADLLYKGIPLALTGERSGRGKTTACQVGLYAFGNAQQMTIGCANATVNALWATFGTLNNLPILLDEVSKFDAEKISDVAYQITQGQERKRMRSTHGEVMHADQATFALHSYMTANISLTRTLATLRGNTEAEAVRILEIPIDEYNVPDIGQSFAQREFAKIAHNHSVAGQAFIEHVVNNRKAVQELWNAEMARLEEVSEMLRASQYRFYRSHIVCTITALRLCRELKLLTFDADHLFGWIVRHLDKHSDTLAEVSAATPESYMERMIHELMPRIISTKGFDDGHIELDLPRLSVPMAGRYVRGTTPSDPNGGKLFLLIHEFQQWCQKHRVNRKDVLQAAEDRGALVSKRFRTNVHKGTALPPAVSDVMIIDMHRMQGLASVPMLSVVSTPAAEATA